MRRAVFTLGRHFTLASRPRIAPSTGQFRAISVSAISQDEKASGTVKWFSVAKGYGFITPTDGTEDIFVHQTNIVADGFRTLAEGESVEFDLSNDANGRLRAINVTGPDGASPIGTPRESSRDYGGGGGGGGGYSSRYDSRGSGRY